MAMIKNLFGDLSHVIEKYLPLKERFFLTQNEWIDRISVHMRDTHSREEVISIFSNLLDQITECEKSLHLYKQLLTWSDFSKPWRDHIIHFDYEDENFFDTYHVSLPLRGFIEHIIDFDLLETEKLRDILESYFDVKIFIVKEENIPTAIFFLD